MVYDSGMIDRKTDVRLVRTALKRSRVVALLGPRQCGKTTLARQLVPADSLNYFDLEDPLSLARLAEPDRTERVPIAVPTASAEHERAAIFRYPVRDRCCSQRGLLPAKRRRLRRPCAGKPGEFLSALDTGDHRRNVPVGVRQHGKWPYIRRNRPVRISVGVVLRNA